MGKRLAIMALVLTIVLLMVSCAGEAEELPSAEEIVANTIQSMQEVNTHQFEMDLTIEGIVDYRGLTVDEDFSVVIGSIGTIDNVNRRLWAEMEATMHTTGSVEDYDEASMEMYVIEDDSYTLMKEDTFGEEELTLTWVKESIPLASWKDMSEIYSQVAVLETGEVDRVSSEKLEGTSYYVLEIIPNEEKLAEIVIQNTPQQWMDMSRYLMFFATESGEGMEELHQSFSVKQWVDKETFYIAKQEVIVERELTLDDFWGKGETSMTIELTMTTVIYNYNDQVNIELPAEAQD